MSLRKLTFTMHHYIDNKKDSVSRCCLSSLYPVHHMKLKWSTTKTVYYTRHDTTIQSPHISPSGDECSGLKMYMSTTFTEGQA